MTRAWRSLGTGNWFQRHARTCAIFAHRHLVYDCDCGARAVITDIAEQATPPSRLVAFIRRAFRRDDMREAA